MSYRKVENLKSESESTQDTKRDIGEHRVQIGKGSLAADYCSAMSLCWHRKHWFNTYLTLILAVQFVETHSAFSLQLLKEKVKYMGSGRWAQIKECLSKILKVCVQSEAALSRQTNQMEGK